MSIYTNDNVNDSFRKEPDAGKPQVRILRGAYDRKGCVYSTPCDFLKEKGSEIKES